MYLKWHEVQKQWDMWDYAALLVALAVPVSALLLHFELSLWGCTFLKLTGWPCFSCGLTRATLSLAAGKLGQAFGYSPLGVVLEAAMALVALWGFLSRRFVWKRPSVYFSAREKRWLWGVGVGLVLLNYAQLLSYHRPWE